MPPKRKRDILDFDPNKSDSEDENFEPEVDRSSRSRKRSRPGKGGKGLPSRRRVRYHGSDIEDDDDVSEDEQEDIFHDDEEEEEEEAPINQNTGRRVRKAATKQQNYKESSDEDEEDAHGESDDNDELITNTPRKVPGESRIIKLKLKPETLRKSAPNPPVTTRRTTRAHTAEVDGDEEVALVELSNSGRHARPASVRGSRSKSPETFTRGRSTRGAKVPRKAPPPLIEEVILEDGDEDANDAEGTADQDVMDVEGAPDAADEGNQQAAEDQPDQTNNEDHPMETVENNDDGDDDDDVPITTRRTRGRVAQASADAPAEDDAVANDENNNTNGRRRLTRKSRLKKSLQEPSSDFEPGNDSEDENDLASEHNHASDGGDDEEYSSQGANGRKSSRAKGRRSTRSRRHTESGDEGLNRLEIAEELEDLREDSQPRRPRRHSPEILFEDKPRRRGKLVNYKIPPLNQANLDLDEDDADAPISTPARGRRGRATAGNNSNRTLHTVAGPFGGLVGDGALFSGPWGNGATSNAGNIDSDSSDDEMGGRPGTVGAMSAGPHGYLGTGQGPNIDGASGIGVAAPNVGKVKDHKALADADPLGVDLSVDFSQVGGMEGHIDQLKEMVQLPLLYPECFTKFHVTPPRGVLFHGPPGTGKTLLARALANSVGFGGKKITFYMRKGADALSKWVGEAEKQLRLLFEEARRTQPSIIFFDEIDGLAPVRSSKQEQIHASIVSTLLALMDGMDGRGQVIVIGATNRPDQIDPALRRPGRFDREFYFPLPDHEARKAIIDIHTKDWGLSDEFKNSLAKDAKGYGGADLRAMCTEAALNAIQRTYPQIYSSKEKLVVDPDKIVVQMVDFTLSKKKITPSSERSSTSGAAPLPTQIEPLLRDQFQAITTILDHTLPRKKKVTALEEAMFEPYEDDDFGFDREALQQEFESSRVFRPRLLICGTPGMGQSYINSAILHYFEGIHVQNFDLPTILGDARPAEQVLVGLFAEVKRHKPSVIFIPNVDTWYSSLAGPTMTAFLGMLRSIQPTDPIMVLGTAETEDKHIDSDLKRDLFGFSSRNIIEISRPAKENRQEYFSRIISHIRRLPKDFPDPTHRKKRQLEELPVAPPPPPKVLTKEEERAQRIRYRQYLNLMKVHLQPIMDQISKKYQKFRQPVIPESQYQYLLDEADPNYVRPDMANALPRPFELDQDAEGTRGIRSTANGDFFYNLDINTIETRLANGYYMRPFEFLKDVRTLERDAKNIGDRQRWLRASELLANVEVDVTDVDQKLRAMGINWEELYAVDQRRRAEKEEKSRKRKALQNVIDQAQSDAGNAGVSSQNGAGLVTSDTTTAHFQVIGSLSNGPDESLASHVATNGTSVPSQVAGDDVQMSGVETPQPVRHNPLMQPPSQWPRIESRSLEMSTMATPGGTSRLSQVSAVQSLALGMSPSALLNDASTTKTSDPSNRSSNFSTQATNGIHHDRSSPIENIPDTQPYPPASQANSSDEQWPHSQAQALQRGLIRQPESSLGSRIQASPAGGKSSHAPSMANLLNDPSPDEPSQSQRQSQQVELDEASASFFLEELTKRTSGCTIEQLQQITHELMKEIWRTRGEHNRMKVLNSATRVFNEAINDIQLMQRVLQSSQ
ncbi:hypothetical protein F4775DRAFT_587617 [Biscogniauxia sp. FL1348]|nr:hypothetical protein F4775DRAFT_587617 [Biscogniauxia sp. FL1348]